MSSKVFALDTKSGIQRDGTIFDKQFYNDGQWVRFQRGRPRKMLGYRQITEQLNGPSRGIWATPQNGFTKIFSGYSDGLQSASIDNNGIGSGSFSYTLSNFTASPNNLWQFDGFYDVGGAGVATVVAHPGQNLTQIDSTVNTPVLIGDVAGTTFSKIGVFTNATITTVNASKLLTVVPTDDRIDFGQSVTGSGIPASTDVVSSVFSAPALAGVSVTGVGGQIACTAVNSGLFVGQSVTVSGTLTGTATGITTGVTYYIIATNNTSTFTLSATVGGTAIVTTAGTTTGLIFTLGLFQEVEISNAATATAVNVTLTFDNNVDVSGGVVVLHPYVFVYGNNGLIRNCSAGDAQDWVSADANETNVASGKIVQGLPVRGGSNSPSGLFWSLDSLVKVSYSPQSLGVSGTNNFSTPTFWRYDIISSQTSILSSQCVIEYDGIYYWIGVDRFLMYNGVVKEVPNTMNQNWFFDNLNYNQREKVWAQKVPRYGEIWWYYPRGDATECTDAIIYNVREGTWYDAGQALGARRSAGYFSQVFSYPVNAGWDVTEAEALTSGAYNTTNTSDILYSDTYDGDVVFNCTVTGAGIPVDTRVIGIVTSGVKTLTNLIGGTLYTDGTYNNTVLTGGSGFQATANITVSGGSVTVVTLVSAGATYVVGDVLSATAASLGGTGSGFSIDVSALWPIILTISNAATATAAGVTLSFTTTPGLISLWQHEYGVDEVRGQNQNAIESYFETNDLGLVSGGPSEVAMVGINNWLDLERLEPDFLQVGQMELYITGRPYAQVEDQTTGPYVFEPGTGKIDLREQRRELRLIFKSNVQGGDYQMGKVIVSANVGDERGYGGS
jgi:hypothetical protein